MNFSGSLHQRDRPVVGTAISSVQVKVNGTVVGTAAYGISRPDAVDAMLNSAITSPMLRHRGPAVLPGALPDPAWFNCRMMQKDLLLALELARASSLPMPTTSLLNEWMTACRGSDQ